MRKIPRRIPTARTLLFLAGVALPVACAVSAEKASTYSGAAPAQSLRPANDDEQAADPSTADTTTEMGGEKANAEVTAAVSAKADEPAKRHERADLKVQESPKPEPTENR